MSKNRLTWKNGLGARSLNNGISGRWSTHVTLSFLRWILNWWYPRVDERLKYLPYQIREHISEPVDHVTKWPDSHMTSYKLTCLVDHVTEWPDSHMTSYKLTCLVDHVTEWADSHMTSYKLTCLEDHVTEWPNSHMTSYKLTCLVEHPCSSTMLNPSKAQAVRSKKNKLGLSLWTKKRT